MAIPPTFLTTHVQDTELADKIAEDDCAVAGHWRFAAGECYSR